MNMYKKSLLIGLLGLFLASFSYGFSEKQVKDAIIVSPGAVYFTWMARGTLPVRAAQIAAIWTYSTWYVLGSFSVKK